MYLQLTEKEIELIKDISKITLTNYDLKDNTLEISQFIPMLEDLKNQLDYEREKYNTFLQFVEDNYKQVKTEEQL